MLKMKDLETRTGVSREAIHFYLREGLLPEPERPKRNVALYTDEHVVRIRTIKRLQQERSLPLREIKELLADFDYEAMPAGDDLARFELTVQAHVNGELPTRDVPLDDVAGRTGLSRETLTELDALGVISIREVRGRAHLDFRDLGVVDLWAKLLSEGFEGKPGYDSTYLARFAEAMSSIAEIEVDNFLAVFGDMPTDEAAELAARGIATTNEILTRLRTQALMRVLHQRVAARS